MKSITRISSLRFCGIFLDFTWPSDVPDCGRYNLIYGWNGTGKTTLSRVLRCLEKGVPPQGQVAVDLDGRSVHFDQFAKEAVPIRVFNRDFVTDNVFPVGGGNLPLIFVLGSESVEKQKEVERRKGERSTAQSKLDAAQAAKERADKDLEQFSIDRAKNLKDMLRSSGQNPYNNYDKTDFKRDAQDMTDRGGASQHLDDADRERLIAQHRAFLKPKVQEVTYALPDVEAIVCSLSQLLMTTVVAAGIEALKRDPTLAEWTRHGLQLHSTRDAKRCLFCEQMLPEGRLAALEGHFSAQYEKLMQRLDQLIGQFQASLKTLSELRLPNKAELYDDLASEYQAAETGLREALNAVRDFLDAAVQAITEKRSRAFEQVSLALHGPAVDVKAVETLNAVIRKHNNACDGFQVRIDEARKRLASDMIAEASGEFVRLRDTVQQGKVDFDKAKEQFQGLNEEITRLEKEIVEHRQPAEELNADLHRYLGHDELRLEVKDTGYTITRHGDPPLTLSEGEMTAIALLYFLKSLQDRRFDLATGIIVLDDPVSSLDANALYLAFGFIRERVQGAGQVFIFTHNFTFFRQVRNWFHHMKGQKREDINKRPARFFMLNCARGENGRCAAIQRLDPLLENYESEYHYLFFRVYRASAETDGTGLEQNYVLPNIARRMLEAFLAFRQPEVSGELSQKMQAVRFDEAKKLRILRFLHTHSHSSDIGEPEHDLSVLAEGPTVLKDLMEMIRSLDPEHFSAMERIVAPPSD